MPALTLALDSASDAFAANRAPHARADRAMARARGAHPRRQREGGAAVRQARPAAAARARRAPARSRRALPRAVDARRLAARTRRRRALGAGRRHDLPASASSPACASWSSPTTPASTPARCRRRGSRSCCARRQIALENRLPFVHLVESAGANLLQLPGRAVRPRRRAVPQPGAALGRRAAGDRGRARLVDGGRRLHDRACADYVIMVRGRARAFLAGPPLLKAATGEIATDEELGGAEMHATRLGPRRVRRRDDASALAIARELIAALGWQPRATWPDGPRAAATTPRSCSACSAPTRKKPVDMRQVIARIVDASDFLEFKPDYGPATVCGHAAIAGFRGRHRHQQRPARSGRQHQGRRTSSRAAASSARRSSACRTRPASSSAARPSAPA